MVLRGPGARLVFDGRWLAVTRWWCPVPGLRVRRFRLAEIVHVTERSPDHDHESPFGYRCVVESTRRVRPYRFWCWRPFDVQEVSRARHLPRVVYVFAMAVQQAVVERQRAVLTGTYGLGPWPEETWREVERIAPGLTALAPGGDHRSTVERTLAAWRGEPLPEPFPRLAPPTTSTAPPWPSPTLPGFVYHAEWRALIDGLDTRAQVETTPEWQAYRAELMRCARARLQEVYATRSPLRKRLRNGF
ncbi:hypothetical protein LG634_09000 [Streptomyces bambusae]|uniref:hypothetical protein n=1 Tax=Streptomyces bambusae TaxID=1550616 RepID=UPI001CFC9E56|nr:hypothetical protein [Streptomyces bambusae]MCB5164965.1 hypothetical protein [Streptomyces bambusae]